MQIVLLSSESERGAISPLTKLIQCVLLYVATTYINNFTSR